MKITAWNRGPEARLHVIPQLVLRNTWSWEPGTIKPSCCAPSARAASPSSPMSLGMSRLYFDGDAQLLFTENETNAAPVELASGGYFKDGFHERIVDGRPTASIRQNRHQGRGVASRHHRLRGSDRRCGCACRARATPALRGLRRHAGSSGTRSRPVLRRSAEGHDLGRRAQRAAPGLRRHDLEQAVLSSRRPRWLKGDPGQPPPPEPRKHGRNSEWRNLNNADILSMPDKWEYPWYASWDLAFHCIPFALIDAEFAKHQLVLLTREWYMHPNGQIPAYEWAFSDVNPPVHGWAAWRVYQIDRKQNGGTGRLEFLERVFHKLMLNFTWWVNRKDQSGRNIFQGGFLGLDNIGVFDRSAQLPTGGYINQSDGTSWMAMYALNLMRIALGTRRAQPCVRGHRQQVLRAFPEHRRGHERIYNDDRPLGRAGQFFYDVLNLPDNVRVRMRIRSMVGLIPLFAVETLEPELLDKLPGFRKRSSGS
jgi:hypothetical protein